jgi:glycine dehydrogenase subunit 2
MCGFKVKEVPSDSEGNVDIEVLKSMLNENVAAMMLTSPNTLGLYDRNLAAVSRMLHENGSLFYGDGANLNATMGRTRFKDMGFDMMHINLHKTFSTPHGGGGPGSGPLGVTAKLAKFLPIPCIEKIEDRYILNFESEDSIGRIHSFYGNFAICLRAFIYIRMLGADGIREAAETAVLNANYLMARLKKIYNLPIDRTCMHEFVLNDKGIPNGITTNEIAKRILDYGFHAPTVYFPLLISGAMMIEPTETESLESLDRFVEVLEKIRKECDENPEAVLSAPGNTPVRRVDTVLAAKTPVLTWDQ